MSRWGSEGSLPSLRGSLRAIVVLLVSGAASLVTASSTTTYLDRYLQVHPTEATAAGRHDLDSMLEDPSPQARRLWVGFNRGVAKGLERQLADAELDLEVRLDGELILRQALREIFEHEVLRRPERDPLWWTGIIGNATVFLLVRDDIPEEQRLTAAAARAALLPRLARQARETLGATDPAQISPEIAGLAARQVASTARFYREGFAKATEDQALADELERSGASAAAALEELAAFLEDLAVRASGSPRLGEHWQESFRLITGDSRTAGEVLAAAEEALAAKRAEVAEYGRSVWSGIFRWEDPPANDVELVRRLFARVEADRCTSTDELVIEYRRLIRLAERFARENEVVTLPDPFTVVTDRSPDFFVGQSVGGVYPAGPFAPETDTLLFLPTPPSTATAEQRDTLFKAFNHHFNVMIAPHEIVPGHYLQLKYAARHPSKTRALFADGVYVEGWGTFVERLMLDEGWGGPLDRLAHLKKQLENIARTIVDIRVHTTDISREEVLTFVRDEALQDEQFSANMWMRAITSSPQLTFYYLGYEQVMGLYRDARAERGDDFVLRDFTDGMMQLGPVPVRHYRRLFLGESGSPEK